MTESREGLLQFAGLMEAELRRIDRWGQWERRGRWWFQCRLRELEEDLHFAVIERRPVAPIAAEIALVAMRIAEIEAANPAGLQASAAPRGESPWSRLGSFWISVRPGHRV